jgi:hypothetical protein
MTGLVGALVAFAVVLAIVLVLAVRPPARRFTRVAAAVRADLTVRLDRLRALRRAGGAGALVVEAPSAEVPLLTAPAGVAASPSPIGGRGRHRRVDGAP